MLVPADSVGNRTEYIRLLTRALNLQRERGSELEVALILVHLSDANRNMGFTEEGIRQTKEGLEIFERLGNTVQQAQCLIKLARLLNLDKQFEAAEEAAIRGHDLFSEKGDQFGLCESHRVLDETYQLQGETKKAIHHFEVALRVASPFN